MTKHFNKRSELEKRRFLRKNSTKAEIILWKYLKNSQLENTKFRRQYSIDHYVIDFYSPQIKLAVEVDGYSHLDKEQILYDTEREKHIKVFGIQFLRFTNDEVYKHIDSVLNQLSYKIIELNKLRNHSTAPPYQGGEKGEVERQKH